MYIKNIYDNGKIQFDKETEYLYNGIIYCKACRTPRQKIMTIAGDDVKVKKLCKCQEEKIKREEEKRLTEERRARIEKLRANSLLGVKYAQVDFETTDTEDQQFKAVFERCKKYCEVADEVLAQGIGIYLSGSHGTGKTHLTACMANYLMNEFYSVMFTNFSQISQSIRNTFNQCGVTESAVIEKLVQVDFLFIDDFGTEMVSRNNEDLWLQEKIFEIVNQRYNNNKPIIFTSNYSIVDMALKRGLADKTIDRINETCEFMKLDSMSYRFKVKKQRQLPF